MGANPPVPTECSILCFGSNADVRLGCPLCCRERNYRFWVGRAQKLHFVSQSSGLCGGKSCWSRRALDRLLPAKGLGAGDPKVLKLREADPLIAAWHQLSSHCSEHLHGNVQVLKLHSMAGQGLVAGGKVVFQVAQQPHCCCQIINQLLVCSGFPRSGTVSESGVPLRKPACFHKRDHLVYALLVNRRRRRQPFFHRDF